MLLRKSLMEEELLQAQLRYDQLFRTSQVVNETEKKVYRALLEEALDDIVSLRNKLQYINNLPKNAQ